MRLLPFMLALLGCAPEQAPARPQLLVVLDTDLPLVGQALDDPRISLDATVDSLRIDIIGPDGEPAEHLTVVAPDVNDWPISFGVVGGQGQHAVSLRAYLFRSTWTTTAELKGEMVVEPFPSLAVIRALEIQVPNNEVRTVRSVLRGDCIGVAPSFVPPYRSCVAQGLEAELATSGVVVVEGSLPPSEAGTWPRAFEQACVDAAPADAACIPGGFTVLGEPGLTNVSDGILYQHDPVPARPVALRPFHLDIREYTVERFRAALKADPLLLSPEEMPTMRDPSSAALKNCTFVGLNSSETDMLPLNCVSGYAAQKLCQGDGGDLPSEAQWEHAARGRGERRRYAWGNAPASCCDATLAVLQGVCPGEGPRPPDGGPGCGEHLDVSRDGVLDMTGNLRERTLDAYEPYDAPCWNQQGVLEDPVCESGVVSRVNRGGSWTTGLELGMLALRATGYNAAGTHDVGFRCAYPDEGEALP